MDELRQHIAKLLTEKGIELKAASKRIGRNDAYLHQYLSYGKPRVLAERDRHRLATLLGVDEATLRDAKAPLSPKPETPAEIVGPDSPDKVYLIEGHEYVAVARYNLQASAGPGREAAASPALLHHHLFRLQWLRRVTAAPLERLAMIEVVGDSMEPTLRSGDTALIDLDQRNPARRDGMYVLNNDGDLQVKRVAAHPVTHKLTISSDNPAYRPWIDIAPDTIDIVGLVIWVGRRI